MIIDIVTHTPIWVFILFIGLLLLGYMQTKDRKIKIGSIFILPISMILLSIFGIISTFGIMPTALFLWFFGIVIALMMNAQSSCSRRVKYSSFEKVFFIPGSWKPMILILLIFFIKYFVGVVTSLELEVIKQIEFIVVISILYGLISGMLLSRSIAILKTK